MKGGHVQEQLAQVTLGFLFLTALRSLSCASRKEKNTCMLLYCRNFHNRASPASVHLYKATRVKLKTLRKLQEFLYEKSN